MDAQVSFSAKENGEKTILGQPIIEVTFNGAKTLMVTTDKGELRPYDKAEKTIDFTSTIDGVDYIQTNLVAVPLNSRFVMAKHTIVGKRKDGSEDSKTVVAKWYRYGEKYVTKEYLICDNVEELNIVKTI